MSVRFCKADLKLALSTNGKFVRDLEFNHFRKVNKPPCKAYRKTDFWRYSALLIVGWNDLREFRAAVHHLALAIQISDAHCVLLDRFNELDGVEREHVLAAVRYPDLKHAAISIEKYRVTSENKAGLNFTKRYPHALLTCSKLPLNAKPSQHSRSQRYRRAEQGRPCRLIAVYPELQASACLLHLHRLPPCRISAGRPRRIADRQRRRHHGSGSNASGYQNFAARDRHVSSVLARLMVSNSARRDFHISLGDVA